MTETQTFTSLQEFRKRYLIRASDPAMQLGSGSYGRVVKAEDTLETDWVAIKISEYKGIDERSLLAEVKLAQRLPRHQNIARYDSCYRLETDTGISDFAVMKYYADGNLADLLGKTRLTTAQVTELAHGMLLGLQHLHRNNIVHRDLKPANILISRDYQGRLVAKIADFGLSRQVSAEDLSGSDFELSDGRGTPSYKAPEQIAGQKAGFNLDLWALGVILYEILTGERPFQVSQRNTSEQSARIEIERQIMQAEIPAKVETLAEPFRSIIKRCLVKDIHRRVRRADELLQLLDNDPNLLEKAQAARGADDFRTAIAYCQQLLEANEDHTEARKLLAECRLLWEREKARDLQEPATPPAEATDVFGQTGPTLQIFDDKTEMFLPPPPARPSVSPAAPSPAPEKPLNVKMLAAGVAGLLALGGLAYVVFAKKQSLPPVNQAAAAAIDSQQVRQETWPATQQAGILPETKLTASGNEKNAEISKEEVISSYLKRSQKAFVQKNYQQALLLTEEVLFHDPRNRQALTLRAAAQKQLQQTPPAVTLPVATETVAATPPQPDVEEEARKKRLAELQENQRKFDDYMAEGNAAISRQNNKAAAVAAFGRAVKLAGDHADEGLNTVARDQAYATYMAKGDRIFNNEEYEGARGWYMVAQSLRDTPDVRAKIKKCNNNL